MPLPSNTHAPFSLSRLDPVGFCDACGFKYPLHRLRFRQQWAGSTLVTIGSRVCPRCLDEPNEQLRVVHLGAEPKPLKDPRPGAVPPQPRPPRQLVLDDPADDILDDATELG